MTESAYYFEDFSVGRVFPLASKLVTADEIVEFAAEFDPQPMHIDEAAGKASILGGLSASGWHTASMFMRMMYDGWLSSSSSEGSPGIEFMEWKRPVLAGDMLSGRSTVLESRTLRSRPGIGMVKFLHEVENQRGEIVMRGENPIMMRLRDAREDAA
ncbi:MULTISPECIES: MaoC family dehydratase [unclassified Neorhizobium]|uniref:MaoC family dehydratase n=1 Tax=unclassified Neorhizobium TaxID=2629175 RepID=UPI001FF531D7|nr:MULTISPECIES: MaoC family dehydratase [unclassified Neorhizobium]MCJ9671201.1 MaoC family dehydratase [Neorhizobium sp. SHOUNA12B]MCJ9746938.1 MaoC family dehydratase [Neorhizobium sp. SHOUNA12A]